MLLLLEKHGGMTLAQLQEATGVSRYATIRDTARLMIALGLIAKSETTPAIFTIVTEAVL
jgi:hypothetical protein